MSPKEILLAAADEVADGSRYACLSMKSVAGYYEVWQGEPECYDHIPALKIAMEAFTKLFGKEEHDIYADGGWFNPEDEDCQEQRVNALRYTAAQFN